MTSQLIATGPQVVGFDLVNGNSTKAIPLHAYAGRPQKQRKTGRVRRILTFSPQVQQSLQRLAPVVKSFNKPCLPCMASQPQQPRAQQLDGKYSQQPQQQLDGKYPQQQLDGKYSPQQPLESKYPAQQDPIQQTPAQAPQLSLSPAPDQQSKTPVIKSTQVSPANSVVI